jgi:hypothetical protein
MRRLPILFAFALAFALLILAPVSAEKKWNCTDRPEHPTCSTTPTTIPEPPTLQACTDDVLLDIGNGAAGRVSFGCLWTPNEIEATVGTVTVEPSLGISQLVVWVLDSSPGDICVVEQPGTADSAFVATFDLAYGELPVDTDWDQDDDYPDFEPYENNTYWEFGGTQWCYPQDTVAGMRQDLNGEPLHVRVNFVAKKNTTVNISLNPPQEVPTTP